MDELLQIGIALLALIGLISCGWTFYLLHLTGHPTPIDWPGRPAKIPDEGVNLDPVIIPVVLGTLFVVFAIFLVVIIAIVVAAARSGESDRYSSDA